MDRRLIGMQAEARARQFLTAQGLTVVCENFRCKGGELDLVATDGQVLAIVEVRARTDNGYGDAADSVIWRKQVRIIRATKFLLMKHSELQKYPVRFDVVTLDRNAENPEARINWIQGAFGAGTF